VISPSSFGAGLAPTHPQARGVRREAQLHLRRTGMVEFVRSLDLGLESRDSGSEIELFGFSGSATECASLALSGLPARPDTRALARG
jgi:hypothetical protein